MTTAIAPRLRLPARLGTFALIGLGLSACGSVDRLANVGKAPNLSAIENPTTQPGYRPVQMPMPAPKPLSYQANSSGGRQPCLFQGSARPAGW